MTSVLEQELDQEEPPSAACLPEHAFVYLWPPGEHAAGRPVLGQVQRATAHVIQARNLGGRENEHYDVSDLTPPEQRWTWELAALPEHPLAGRSVTLFDWDDLDREAGRQWLLGNEGVTLTVHTIDGNSVAGVVTGIAYRGDTPAWLMVSNLPDSQRRWRIRVPVNMITQIKEIESA